MVDGIAQKPIEGVSIAYTFDKANANAPSTHGTQYFEMFGLRALYHDGWMLSTVPSRPPWELLGKIVTDPANAYQWELYDVTRDWTQNNNVAASNPEKVKEMQQLLWVELAKYSVLPLDASIATRLVAPRPNVAAGRTTFTYSGEIVTGIPHGDAPNLLNTSYIITADIDIPQGGAEGMIQTNGGRFGGYGFYLLKGKPVFLWNLLDLKRTRWESADVLRPGKHTLEFDFTYDGLGFATLAFNNISGIGKGGTGVLKVDGKVVSTQKMDRTVPLTLQWDEKFDIDADTGTPIYDNEYQIPFKLTRRIKKLTIKIEPPKLTSTDEQKLKEAAARAGDA
jgi:arylsulfatase